MSIYTERIPAYNKRALGLVWVDMAPKKRQVPQATQKPQRIGKSSQVAQQAPQDNPVLRVVDNLCSCLGRLEECIWGGGIRTQHLWVGDWRGEY